MYGRIWLSNVGWSLRASMKYRRLGRTGLSVSEIGFGTWGIGGTANGAIGYGPTDDKQSRKALIRAFELGVNFFDTADLYGTGHSEELLGEVFSAIRDKVFIASKVGYVTPYGRQNFSLDHLRRALHESLRRLKTDYLDLYQLHDPPLSVLDSVESPLEFLGQAKAAGLIRSFGISLKSPNDGLFVIEKGSFECIQTNFNLVDRRALDNGLFAACQERNIGVICRTPLCFGFLAGQPSDDNIFQSGDHRSSWFREQRNVWVNAYQMFFPSDDPGSKAAAQNSLRFCLSYSEISTVIPGMLTSDQAEENVEASSLGPLGPEDLDRIADIYRRHTFFLGYPSTLRNDAFKFTNSVDK
jgi:aryl-alcohol dehydrogenase-like predicted oxidoreductase